MINIPNKYHFPIKPLITYYLITLLIYIQLYLLPYLIYPKTYTSAMTFYKINTDRISAIFFILPFFLLFQKPKDYLRERPKFIYLLIYPVFCGIFFIYLFYLLNIYPLKALNSGNSIFFIKLARLLDSKALFLTTRFRILYFLSFASCQCLLLLCVFSINKFLTRYIRSILLGVLFTEVIVYFLKDQLNSFVWPVFSYGVAKINIFLLKIFRFKIYPLELLKDNVPRIGTDVFEVQIGPACSGVEGVSFFLIIFAIILALDWKKLNKKKALIVAVSGTCIMYITNILRIFILILVGHFWGSETAINVFHSCLGMILYALIIITIFAVSYRWMIEGRRQL